MSLLDFFWLVGCCIKSISISDCNHCLPKGWLKKKKPSINWPNCLQSAAEIAAQFLNNHNFAAVWFSIPNIQLIKMHSDSDGWVLCIAFTNERTHTIGTRLWLFFRRLYYKLCTFVCWQSAFRMKVRQKYV